MQAAGDKILPVLLWEYQGAGEMMSQFGKWGPIITTPPFWCNLATVVTSKSHAFRGLDMNDLYLCMVTEIQSLRSEDINRMYQTSERPMPPDIQSNTKGWGLVTAPLTFYWCLLRKHLTALCEAWLWASSLHRRSSLLVHTQIKNSHWTKQAAPKARWQQLHSSCLCFVHDSTD